MDISVNPSEVKAFAQQLKQWASQMKTIERTIMQKTRNLEQHWKDAQFKSFVDIVQTQGRGLITSIEQFEHISKELLDLAKQLEDMKRQQQARINNLRR